MLNSSSAVSRIWNGSITGSCDDYYLYVSLLLHLNGSNGSTTFIDDSSNPKTVQAVGSPSVSDTNPKFGSGSVALNGTTDYLTVAENPDLTFGQSDFTVELWVYQVNSDNYDLITFAGEQWEIYIYDSSYIYFWDGIDTRISGSFVSANVWNHVALVRQGEQVRLYLNGIQTGSTYIDSGITYLTQGTLYIGHYPGATYVNGYIDEVRITKGIARYTTNFSPSSSPFPNIACSLPPSGAMILVYDTNLGYDNLIDIPFDGTVNVIIDWGDGTPLETVTTSQPTHTYATSGIYFVTVTGSCTKYGYDLFSRLGGDSLTAVISWGNLGFTDLSYAFYNAYNLVNVPANLPSTVTTLAGMFWGSSNFNDAIETWNTQNITNMYGMFLGADLFNQPIGNWNVGNVTNMESMFEDAVAFNQPIDSWNVSSVTTMESMFEVATAFNQPLNSWDVSSVTTMRYMFLEATSFNQPLNNWNVSNVTNFTQIFSDATSMNSTLAGWNLSSAPGAATELMFDGASSFNASVENWILPPDIPFLFENATAFNHPSILTWDVSGVTDFGDLFRDCTSFNQPIGSWDMSSAILLGDMFRGAAAFNQPLGSWNVSNVTAMTGMFRDAVAFNQPIGSWNVSNVINMEVMFQGATMFNQSLGSWNVGNVLRMAFMFSGATSFNQDIGSWNVSSVIGTYSGMTALFNNASSFNQDLSGWCVTNILTEPLNFSTGSPLTALNKPVWGTCPP